jgi:hypothetical protein
MKIETGADGISYDYFSTNGQMARELKRSIKEKARLELALELLAAVNRDAWDRGARKELSGPVAADATKMIRGRLFKRVVIHCDRHNREETRWRQV